MRYLLASVAMLLVGLPGMAQDAPGAALFKTVKEKIGAEKPFSLIVTLKVKDGSAEKFAAAAAIAASATLKEKGCLAYEFHQSTEDANTFYLVEKWTNLAALEAHFKEEHLVKFLGQFGELADGAPKIVVGKFLPPAK